MLNRLFAELWRRSGATKHPPQPSRDRALANSRHRMDEVRMLVEKHPSNVELLCELGTLEGENALLDAAILHLSRAVALAPQHGPSRISLANALLAAGRPQEAIPHYQQGLLRISASAGAHSNFGMALMMLGNHEAAETQLERALALNDSLAEAHHHLGQLAERKQDATAAWRAYGAALRANPGYVPALNALTQLLVRHDKLSEALNAIERSEIHCPDIAAIPACRGFVYQAQGLFREAITQYQAALSLNPNDADILNDLAIAQQDCGCISEALALYERALILRPEFPQARWHRSLALLAKHDFATGWNEYDLRFLSQIPPARHIPLSQWDGRPLPDGQLLIYAEQGLGDEIMFASCIPDVLHHVKSCTIECAEKLAPIFIRSFPAARVVGTNQSHDLSWLEPLAPLDAAIPIGSLPQFYRRSLESFPKHVGYLRACDEKTSRWRTQLRELGTGLKIGISWRGGSKMSRAGLRSVPLARWLPIMSAPGSHFVSLQYTDCGAELAQLHSQHGITVTHWQAAIDDYDETAALVAALDIVISIQTAVIHLAGALGKRCWVMVPAAPEWRYGSAGMQMPWYPSVKLFRQQELEHWDELINKVAVELTQELNTSRHLDGLSSASNMEQHV